MTHIVYEKGEYLVFLGSDNALKKLKKFFETLFKELSDLEINAKLNREMSCC